MKGYNNYRGRTSTGRRLAVAGMVLILILALGYLAFNAFTGRNSDGELQIRLPFFSQQEKQPEQKPADEELPDVEIIYDEPDELKEDLHAVEITLSQLRGGLDALKETLGADCTALGIHLKQGDGLVHFEGALEDAVRAKDALSAEEVHVLTDSDYYTVARLSCCHDDAAAWYDMGGKGLCQSSGYIWFGPTGHWLDLAKPAARAYLVGLCTELADLGFDEILLDDFGYPTGGKLHKIEYSGGRAESVQLFLAELTAALEEKETHIGVILPEELVLAGADDTAGVSLAKVLEAVDRVYVETADAEAVTAAITAADAKAHIVLIGGESGSYYRAQ